MTEQDLIELGFTKMDVPDVDSGNGYDYYFYQKDIMDGLVLVSSDSIDSTNDNWVIYNHDWPSIKITSKESILALELLADVWGNGNSEIN